MKTYALATWFLLLATLAHGQRQVTDSLAAIIKTLPDDTAKVIALNDLVVKLQYLDPAKAAQTVHQSIKLAERLNYTLGLASAYRLRGVLYVDKVALDSGKLFYDKAQSLVAGRDTRPFRRQAGLLMHNYGVIFHHKQQYDSATARYLEAANIYREINEESLLFFPYANLSVMYSFLKDNRKALRYATQMRLAAMKMNDPGKVVIAVNSEMSIRLDLRQYDSVLIPLRENIRRASKLENYYSLGKAYNSMAQYFGDGKQRYDSAVRYRRMALAMMQRIDNQYEVAGMYQNIGYDYKQLGVYDSAFVYLRKATALAKSLGLEQVAQYSVSNLVDVEEARGNFKQALNYMKELAQINDTILARNNRTHLNELEAKYHAEKNLLQISQLEAEKKIQDLSIRQKNFLNSMLLLGAVILLVIMLLLFRTYRQKQTLQQRRIRELEMEKTLATTEAILKGEEQERTRLAKDLHDGLGGMLSGIKYSFSNMKGNLIMTPENHQAFARSMDMLDSSIMEMRRVAHNMMPEALVKFGLDTALRDYCNDFNLSGAIKAQYQSLGMEHVAIEQTMAITIYRVVQELMTNTLKHAAARNALVQLAMVGNTLTITVEDDGKGFELESLSDTHGIGWTSIRNRIDFLKGRLDVRSQPGKGTSVFIEVDFSKKD